MKESTVHWLEFISYVALSAALAFALASVLTGCASTTPTFQAPELQPVAFAIPVPPPERTCVDPSTPWLQFLPLEEVEADGSVIIQACTDAVLILREDAEKNYNECIAHNEARQLVIEAEREAREELERLKVRVDDE